jgi:hypothetical protein
VQKKWSLCRPTEISSPEGLNDGLLSENEYSGCK